MKVVSITKTGTKSSITVSDELFAAAVNKVVLGQAIRVYLSNLRQGTSQVKTRGEVARTKRKWYKQKGTGNARHGARSAPIFVGGGVTHGPTGLENWSKKLTTKLKKKALISALSAQAKNVYVIDYIKDLNGKTKEAVTALSPILEANDKLLVILPERNDLVERGLRNIPQVLMRTAHEVNALDVALANKIVATKQSIAGLETRLLGTKSAVKPVVKPTATVAETKTAKKAKTTQAAKTTKKTKATKQEK